MLSFIKLAATALLLVASAAPAAAVSEKDAQAAFTSYVKTYNKKYHHDDFFPRYTIFKQNLAKIEQHNAGNHTYTLGLNEHADMTFDEFHSKMTGYRKIDRSHLRSKNELKLTATAPDSIDWTTKGVVTDVKNQGQCGSCWSFSTTGSVEGAWAIAGNPLVALSEQQLVDCSTAQGNNGCQGGLMDNAFQYIVQNGGICSEDSYPYSATGPNTCQTTCSPVAKITSFVDVPKNDADALKTAVGTVGPVSVAIEADQQVFQFYSGGVLSDTGCGTSLDHGVLVVGYGHDQTTGLDFWKIKNSWGGSWGESGYIRIVRGQDECGVLADPSYPVVGTPAPKKINNFRF